MDLFIIIAFLVICIGKPLLGWGRYYSEKSSFGFDTPNTNLDRQIELYEEYVCECKCLTERDIRDAKWCSTLLISDLKNPSVIDSVKIDENNPYDNYNPYILLKRAYYASLSEYERYLMAKEKLESEGYVWEDKFNPFVPEGAPDELYRTYLSVNAAIRLKYYDHYKITGDL